ncbi:hypothetical protein A0H81_01691 [Grifola frondosa]|uniref:HMG box domain-containing protein n=1 Tax=Grifola frondosa TaxID=5627 RepID=A0A1C7MLY4_GRIFR|nr:hypothetical protein A0H81_01691 [Grifola frondosa]
MFSLFTQRVVLRAITPNAIAIGRAIPASKFSPVTRTFLTTAHVAFPAAKTTSRAAASKPSAAKKAPAKKALAKAPVKAAKKPAKKPVKRVAAKKKPAPKKKAAAKRKPKSPGRITLKDLKQKPASGEELIQFSKGAATHWKSLSDEEKQVYIEEAKEWNAKATKEREEYFTKVDPRILRAINVQRRSKGLPRVRAPKASEGDRRPMTAFFQYLKEFRAARSAPADLEGRAKTTWYSSQAAAAWRDMSEAHKKPYYDAYVKDMKAYEATHST